jgi:hypothetical protein
MITSIHWRNAQKRMVCAPLASTLYAVTNHAESICVASAADESLHAVMFCWYPGDLMSCFRGVWRGGWGQPGMAVAVRASAALGRPLARQVNRPGAPLR